MIIGICTKFDEYPFLAKGRDDTAFIITHEHPDHNGVWCGVCLYDNSSTPLFKSGDVSSDLSSSNLSRVRDVILQMGGSQVRWPK